MVAPGFSSGSQSFIEDRKVLESVSAFGSVTIGIVFVVFYFDNQDVVPASVSRTASR